MKSQSTDLHTAFMQRAIELARKALGQTAPNPPVGALIVKNGKIIAEGFHKKAGTPHAEVHALKKAGSSAKGATLYVTLEPCCHCGRTGPCTEAIIASGIKKVVVGCKDPNPQVAGKGLKALRKAGLIVELGVEQVACEELIRAFRSRILTGRPFVLGKIAQSLDGKIATKTFASKWISNGAARKYAHQLRQQSDALLIGANTVRKDDPLLTVRLSKTPQMKPVVVVDSSLLLEPNYQIFSRPKGMLILATTEAASLEKREQLKAMGHTVWVLPQNAQGQVALDSLLDQMGAAGWNQILTEGGSTLLTALLKARLLDALVVALAPVLIGADGLNSVASLDVNELKDAINLHHVKMRQLDDNVIVEGLVRE